MFQPSPIFITPQPSLTTTKPATTSFPAPTTTFTSLPPSPTPIFEVVIDNLAIGQQGQLYFSGFGANGDDLRHYAQWDGAKWIALGNGFQTAGNSLVVDGVGHLYTKILFDSMQGMATAIMRWDGENWTQINTSKLNISLNIALDQSERLYASGQWSVPGEVIAHWDGKDWMTITDQLEGEAPGVLDMAVDTYGHLYIGGSFESVSGIPAQNIAYWYGSLWHALGDGVNERVEAIAFDPGGGLYTVGFFY
jgi:hypothetical protein